VDVLSGICRVGECPAYTVGDVRASLLPAMEFDQVCRVLECLEYRVDVLCGVYRVREYVVYARYYRL